MRPARKLHLDFAGSTRLGVRVDRVKRSQIDGLAAQLAGILEDLATDAALLTRVPDDKLGMTIDRFQVELGRSLAYAVQMRTFNNDS